MSTTIKILLPEATTNYIENPSFRYDTTGWNAVGSTITRVLEYALFGISSLKVVTPGLVQKEGVYYRVNSLSGTSSPITISAYVRGAGTVQLRLIEGVGKEWISKPCTMKPDMWTRMVVSGFTTGSNDLRMYIETYGNAGAYTFYLDGCQMELKACETTYCDGDQPDCRWNIINSASESSRPNNTKKGGRWVSLTNPCGTTNDVYITLLGGLGMEPITNNIQSWALSPGAFYQSTKILERPVTLTFNLKHESKAIVSQVDRGQIHQLRQQLIDIFKADLTADGEAFKFSFQEGDNGKELFLNMRYESGLEGSWDIRNQWSELIPIRFLAVDPSFVENNLNAMKLNFVDSLINSSYIMRRIDGEYLPMNGGVNGNVLSMEIGKKGEVYLVGLFYIANSGGAIDPDIPALNITYWNGKKFIKIINSITGPGGPSNISAIKVAPNGDVYITGKFTTINGVTVNNVAKWDGSTWSALGNGLTGVPLPGTDPHGMCLEITPTGEIFVGGYFTTAGSVTTANIAKWDGFQWNSVGAYNGLTANNTVWCMSLSRDASILYVGGNFTGQFGKSDLSRVAQYDISSNSFSPMSDGVDDVVCNMKADSLGRPWISGGFVNSGTKVLNYVAYWDNGQWINLGSGLNIPVTSLSIGIGFDEHGNFWVTGRFVAANGNTNIKYSALWNGSTWVHGDFFPGAPSNYYALKCFGKDIYVTNSTPSTSIKRSAITYVTNYGTAEVKPYIYIFGPGRVKWIENITTGKRVYLDLYVFDDEEVIIDFGQAKITSALRGDLTRYVFSGSDFADFVLSPGQNKLCIYMADDVQSLMYMYYQPVHHSIDASVKVELL